MKNAELNGLNGLQ